MNNLKKLTLLHSNDLHGDFLAEKVDEKLIGGVSRLSGYVNKVRNEEKNVIYYLRLYHFGKSTTPDRPDQTWVNCLNLFVAGYTV